MNDPKSVPSIKSIAERRAALLTEAEKLWRDLAKEYERRIPKSMEKWAREHGFIETTVGHITYWVLPEWLDHLVQNASTSDEYPVGNSHKYRKNELETNGFTDFDDLKSKFAELGAAWNGLVRISIDEGELPRRVEVHYYAAELTPECPTTSNKAN